MSGGDGVDRAGEQKWLRTAELYARRYSTLSRTQLHLSDPNLLRQIHDARENLATAFRDFERTVFEDLSRVKRLVSNLKDLTTDAAPAGLQAVVEAALSTVEREIYSLRRRAVDQRPELEREEALLTRDLELMLERMSAPQWTTSAAESPAKPLPTKEQRRSGLLPEVLEYDAYLQEHGETDGWAVADHREFLRLLGICKGDYSLVTELCCQELLGITRSTIVRHGRWHAVFCDLAEKKRAAVSQWRCQKESDRSNRCTTLESEESSEAQKREQERRSFEEKLRRQVQHQLIAAWKKEKTYEASRREAEEKRAAQVQEEKRDADRRAQIAKRQQVLEYKQQRKEAGRRELERRASLERTEQLHAVIEGDQIRQRLERRNRELLQRKAAQKSQQKRQQLEQAIRMERLKEQVRVEVERDPERLKQPTNASRRRQDAEPSPNRVLPLQSASIRHVQHKSVPNWILTARSLTALS